MIVDFNTLQGDWQSVKPTYKFYIFFLINYRCDQYRWVTKGVYTINYNQQCLKKRSNAIDNANQCARVGQLDFRRWEYWGFNSFFVFNYTGDHAAYKLFSHRSSILQQNLS